MSADCLKGLHRWKVDGEPLNPERSTIYVCHDCGARKPRSLAMSAEKPEQTLFPIHGGDRSGRGQGTTPRSVYMAAYEVYSHVCGPQQAMIENGCRGGFGKAELVAFLYARSFPKSEWSARVDEALRGTAI